MIHLKLLEVWQPFEFSTNKTKNTKENVEWEKTLTSSSSTSHIEMFDNLINFAT